ncbi:ribonuclease HII [Candidatus Kaiserbacteria bacterium]|nr:ribonuclease HII [Candidatus Kaiserbacteria bacterium]
MVHYLIGVDEAGRAPLAGPVSVGAVIVPETFDVLKMFPEVKDSKLLSPKKRDEIYEEAEARMKTGELSFCVRFADHAYIDEFGITRAVRKAVQRCVSALSSSPEGVRILLDGLLYAPSRYEQETIIHGDALVPIISLASIVAKVRRDRLMTKFAKRFPNYGFEIHKGYPTELHREAIRRFGLCEIHRVSYSRKFALR